MINHLNAYDVNVDFHFKCKKCGKEYYINERSTQPTKEAVEKFVKYYLERIHTGTDLRYYHYCGGIPESKDSSNSIYDLHGKFKSFCANYGKGELLGFEIDSFKED